jgi:tripartite-type tricarboxylate transporter receptor subunit TctC
MQRFRPVSMETSVIFASDEDPGRLLDGPCRARSRGADRIPEPSIRLVVTVPPGGAADFIARLIGAKLAESLGQPVLVDNRAGAGGTIATDAVAKAPADGYTLLQNSITTHGVGPHLYAGLPYDPVKDFAPVTGLALLPLIMAINADCPSRPCRS